MGSTVAMAKLLALCALCVIFATAALAAPQDLEDEPRSSDVIDEIQGDEPREADLDLSSEDEDDEDNELLDRDDGEETGNDEAQVEPSDRWIRRRRCCPTGHAMWFSRWHRSFRCRSNRCIVVPRRCGSFSVTGRCSIGGSRIT